MSKHNKKSASRRSKHTTLVALGLSSLLPSFAFATKSDEALFQLLAQAPNNPNDSKVQKVADYSPVVDLRTTKTTYDHVYNGFSNGTNLSFSNNSTISVTGVSGGYFDIAATFSAARNATVTMDFLITSEDSAYNQVISNYGVFQGNWGAYTFSGEGAFILNADVNNQTDKNVNTGFFEFVTQTWGGHKYGLDISSSFIFKASGNIGSFLRTVTINNQRGAYRFNSPYIEIDMDNGGKNSNTTSKNFILSDYRQNGVTTFLINANEDDPSQISSQSNILKITGNINSNTGATTNLYAHFTNPDSFLKGNIALKVGTSIISFSNGSSMTGDIDVQGNGNHSITFDGASFIGVAKGNNNGTNATITFANTTNKIFGSNAEGVVASSFKGSVIGSFDVSKTSMTIINGGSDGSKGFLGTGKNKLTFDFKNNAKTGLASDNTRQFTLGGGSANSLYIFNAFQSGDTALDLNSLSADSTLYSKIQDAGINITSSTTDSQNAGLQGTLLFTNTTINVGENRALFGSAENIAGTGKNVNGLALGAMFGNATWVDANNDGSISSDEISANPNNTNYQLIGANTTPSEDNGVDSKTSTGNIGAQNDNIKKQIGFIFASSETTNGYVFNGEKQGYSGTIAGGTADSKYYFANAGYITRSQISDALGDLVLFNTAFRGDLGVDNKDVSIMLDFSGERNGLRAETGTGNANIVGAGSKNITFNFTGNTKSEKFVGAVVGDATQDNSVATGGTPDNQTAKYTMLNLKKYTENDVEATNDGAISANADTRGIDGRVGDKTLIDAIQGAGLTNFNVQNTEQLAGYDLTSLNPQPSNREGETAQKDTKTNISLLSTTNTTLALKGTSLNTTSLNFNDYKYDLAFGSGIGEVEGITIADSKLYGDIDLTNNSNTGHKIILKGDSLGGDSAITFNSTNFGASGGGVFVYDDSTATRTATDKKTLTLNGLSQSNFLYFDSTLSISNTNLVGNIYAHWGTAINLNFSNGNTWSMNESGIYLKGGSNIIINGKVNSLPSDGQQSTTPPVLKLRHDSNAAMGRLEFINTGMTIKLWQQGGWGNATRIGETFNLRGTSLEGYWEDASKGAQKGTANGIHGYADNGIKLVFAKGTNVQTTKEKPSVQDADSATAYYNITEEGSGAGNYIANSYGKFTKVVTKGSVNMTFIGEQSHNSMGWVKSSYYGQASTITFVNASAPNGGNNNNGGSTNDWGWLSATKIGNLTSNSESNNNNNSSARLDVVLEGTSLADGDSLVQRNNQQDKLYFKMTFVGTTDRSPWSYYVDSTSEYATTNANGALQDSILKVKQSQLNAGIDFKGSNFDVLFVGDYSQKLGQTSNSSINVFKNGTASSKVTFRDSDLNAGSTASSLQNIKGTIAFDLSHSGEDMAVYGTLRNMLNGGKHQVQFKAQSGDEPVTIDRLVFVNTSDITNTTTLAQLGTDGQYYKDSEVFSSSTIGKNYSDLAKLNTIDTENSSSLIFGKNGNTATSVALTSGEVFFVGKNSHGFGNTASANLPATQTEGTQPSNTSGVTTLGNSTGGTLTFIDAGELKVANIQNGSGTLNLIGKTSIELQTLNASSSGGASNDASTSSPSTRVASSTSAQTLTLYKAGDSSASTSAITGSGITINAIFSGSNILGTGVAIKGENGGGSDITESVASNVNIGQAGEQTEYHILFDYTDTLGEKENQGFGKYQVYQGNIAGLTSNSIIKFKNAGYIYGDQIKSTDATILLDNTQLKSDFRGDRAILDFRKGNIGIAGNILTSDETNNVLSQKILTFDLTGTTKLTSDNYALQAGYKIAPAYTQNGQSVLTFQNAPTLTLGDENSVGLRAESTDEKNPSAFIQSLASDVGFSAIANAKIDEPVSQVQTPADSVGTIALATAPTIDSSTSYILKGTKLVFQGTNIDASGLNDKAIIENTYELDLSFDNRYSDSARGTTGLGESINSSKLTANSITMGEYDGSRPLGLSLSFAGSGSLAGENISNNGETYANVLNVKLKDNAVFKLDAKSFDRSIGTLVLAQNPSTQQSDGGEGQDNQTGQDIQSRTASTPLKLSAKSSMTIQQGSMGFVGVFDTSADTNTNASDYGTLNLSFGENASANSHNKAYGVIKHKGNTSITLTGNALFSDEDASALGFTKSEDQFANLVIDTTAVASGKTLSLNLAHTSGMVGLIGASTSNSYTNLNLSSVTGDIALKGNFNLTEGASFGGTSTSHLKIEGGSLSLKLGASKSLTIAEDGIIDNASQGSKPSIAIKVFGAKTTPNNLTFTNLGNKISNITISEDSGWGVQGNWNTRGTNIALNTIRSEHDKANNYFKKFVFANGEGTQTTTQDSNGTLLNLSELNTSDKIANSTLTLSGSNIFSNASFTFVGKQALGGEVSSHRIDSHQDNATLSIGLFNSLLKSGDVLLNSASEWNATSLKNVTIRGTDIFNLSASKSNSAQGANNSTINAVFINGSNLVATSTPAPETPDVSENAREGSTPTPLTGNTYINAENGANGTLKATLAQYATSNAGGALSETELKTLQSKAYGNITLDNTVTATMKFIGEDSHSFDGRTIVDNSGNVYSYVGSGSIEDSTANPLPQLNATDWKQLDIDSNGLVSLKNPDTNPTDTTTTKYAQLIGGNTNSRFDFDHTSVALDLVKFAGGKTYVYNSNVSGNIAVANDTGVGRNGVASASIDSNASTTIYFNEVVEDSTLPSASANFIQSQANNGINLDLSTAHTLKQENLVATQVSSDGSTSGGVGTSNGAEGSTGGSVDASVDSTARVGAVRDEAQQPTTQTIYTLANTSKATNLVFIGKGSVDSNINTTASNNSGASIDLSFMPNANGTTSGYKNYTFVNAGEFTQEQIKLNSFNGDITTTPDGSTTIFGTSSVVLIDTYVLGERAFGQKGFIDMGENRNQKSYWSGGSDINQFLIFDFHNGKNNANFNGGSGNAITNTSLNSRYIFTSIFADSSSDTSDRILTLSNPNGLKNAINAQLTTKLRDGTTTTPISEGVVGYLGLRGVSIQGDIDESIATQTTTPSGDTGTSEGSGTEDGAGSQATRDAGTNIPTSGNKVDIVFNSTSNISYVDSFDESGNHTYTIENLGFNKVANITGIDNTNDYASGYAVLKAGNESQDKNVSIKGTASKDIVFIGENSVEGGFDKLKIEGGDNYSHYTFYSVGTLSQTFLSNVGLYKDATASNGVQGANANDKTATAGTFTFANSTIRGNINVDANTTSNSTTPPVSGITDAQASTPTPVSKLIFDNVIYSGELSGSLDKDLKFAKGSNNVVIIGGSENSSYDFSALSGSSINLSIDMTNDATKATSANQTYIAPTIKGFENGDISVVGYLKLGDNTSVAFNDGAKWTMTKDSRVATLTLNNSGANFNLDLASASRNNAVVAQDEGASDSVQSTPNTDLRVLEVGTLSSNGGQVLLGTQIDTQTQSNSKSDKIKANTINGGTFYVTAKDTSVTSGNFETDGDNAIVLVTANNISNAEVTGTERKQGLSYVSTELEHQVYISQLGEWQEANEDNTSIATSHRWVLSSFDTSTNQELVDEGGFLISNPYRMLMIETNNLNKRMGDLRDNDYNQGAWIRVFNGSDSGEGAKNLYTNIQLGYDYGISAIGAKNYTGVAFSTSIVDINGDTFDGKSNTYSLALYNSYIADSGLYVDTIAKYLYTDQKLGLNAEGNNSFGNHSASLGVEFGYRAYVGESSFYFEPQAELIAGVIAGVKDINLGMYGELNVIGELETTFALNTRIGLVQGYTLKTQSGFRADFRLGLSALNEYVSNENPIKLTDSVKTIGASIGNDTKLVVDVGTNLILTDQWRVYIDVEKSFLGKRNVDYQANVGARFSFGEISKPLPKPEKPLPLKVESEEKKQEENEKTPSEKKSEKK